MAPMHFWILYFHTEGHDTQLSKCENGENLNFVFHFLNLGVVVDLFYYSKHAIELCIGSNSTCANNIWCNFFFAPYTKANPS
jgi:hypothetical protein